MPERLEVRLDQRLALRHLAGMVLEVAAKCRLDLALEVARHTQLVELASVAAASLEPVAGPFAVAAFAA